MSADKGDMISQDHAPSDQRQAETESSRILAAIEARKAIYIAKRDACDPFGEEQYSRFDNFAHTVEAFEWLEEEISQLQAPTDGTK